jgi:hypothetical protein
MQELSELKQTNNQLQSKCAELRSELEAKQQEVSAGQEAQVCLYFIFVGSCALVILFSSQSEIAEQLKQANNSWQLECSQLRQQLDAKHQELTIAQAGLQVGLKMIFSLLILCS